MFLMKERRGWKEGDQKDFLRDTFSLSFGRNKGGMEKSFCPAFLYITFILFGWKTYFRMRCAKSIIIAFKINIYFQIQKV